LLIFIQAAESGDNSELLELRKQLQELEGENQTFTACQDYTGSGATTPKV
jgi:hypothetical protein